MLFKYKLSVITLVQFILMTLLALFNQLDSIVSECRRHDGDCLGNTLASLVLWMLIAGLFMVVAALGFSAEERRRKGLVLALIGLEGGIALFALVNAHTHQSKLSLLTSLLDLVLAVWVILLASRIYLAKGGRVVTKQRGRARRRPSAR